MDLDQIIIHSSMNQLYINNPFPKLGETIDISIKIKKTSKINGIFLNYRVDGESGLLKLSKSRSTKKFQFYHTPFTVNQKETLYYFIIKMKDELIFYNKSGLTRISPNDDHQFTILADLDYPVWVPSSVFYQIFPDRFYCGNPKTAIFDKAYQFQQHWVKKINWSSPPPVYKEGHCLDFYGGDLPGIKSKIPYLKELGINAVYLNPIFHSKTHHKYDCIDYLNVDPFLGGNDALVQLVHALHQNDIKIILDISINHTGIAHSWLKKAISDKSSKERTYYFFDKDGNYLPWQGHEVLAKLNYRSENLRDVIYKSNQSVIATYLKEPFNIDGWRFDVANETGNYGPDQFSHEIFKEIRLKVKAIHPHSYIIGEHWRDPLPWLQNDQLDGCMNYQGVCRPIRTFTGEPDRSYWGIMDHTHHLVNQTGILLRAKLEDSLNRLPDPLLYTMFNFIDNHDLYRFHNKTDLYDFSLYCGMLSLLYLLPGTVSIYYGDEIGLDGRIEDFEGYRYPMKWTKEYQNHPFYRLYQKLNRLKISEPVFHTGSYLSIFADNETYAAARFNAEYLYIAVISKVKESKKIQIPLEYFDIDTSRPSINFLDNSPVNVNDFFLPLQLPEQGNTLYKIHLITGN